LEAAERRKTSLLRCSFMMLGDLILPATSVMLALSVLFYVNVDHLECD
jgi:hypothetical protein